MDPRIIAKGMSKATNIAANPMKEALDYWKRAQNIVNKLAAKGPLKGQEAMHRQGLRKMQTAIDARSKTQFDSMIGQLTDANKERLQAMIKHAAQR